MQDFSLTFGSELSTVQTLFFGPHPDDVELFSGGLFATLSRKGYRCGICDLTRGELGSLGTPEGRAVEAARSASLLQAAWRMNLCLPDGSIDSNNPEYLSSVVRLLRTARPELVVAPYWLDRHPDHEAASLLISKGAFFAALKNYAPDFGAPHQPLQMLYYPSRIEASPSFVVDITESHATKQAAILAFESQMPGARTPAAGDNTVVPLVSSRLSLTSLEARDTYFGAMIGASFGEAFIVRNALPLGDPLAHFRSHRLETPLFYLR